MWQQPTGWKDRIKHSFKEMFHDREVVFRSRTHHYSYHLFLSSFQQKIILLIVLIALTGLTLVYSTSFVRLFVAESKISAMRENSVVFRDIYGEVKKLHEEIEGVRGFSYNSPETLRVINDWLNNSKLAHLSKKIENEIKASEDIDKEERVFLLTRQEMAEKISNLQSANEALLRERKSTESSFQSLSGTYTELQTAYQTALDENNSLLRDANDIRKRLYSKQELGQNSEKVLIDFVTELRLIVGNNLYDDFAEDDLFSEAQGLLKTISTIQENQNEVVNREINRTDYSLASISNIIDMTGITTRSLSKLGLLPKKAVGGFSKTVQVAYNSNDARVTDKLSYNQGKLDHKLNELEAMQGFMNCMPLTTPVETHRLSSGFGFRTNPFTGKGREIHYGLDFSAWHNTPIWATSPGKVVYAGRRGAYGNMVEINHGCGFITRYGHMQSIAVDVGDYVQLRQVIGAVGNTGRSTGPHVHYEIRFRGKPLDPAKFIQAGRHVYKGIVEING